MGMCNFNEVVMGNRVYQRLEVKGISADLSDGKGFFPGVVSDVSRFGVGMTDLPKRINENTRRMTVVISGNGKNFKMLVKPRWAESVGRRKIMGFEIINTPFEWTDFIMKLEPRKERDGWTLSR